MRVDPPAQQRHVLHQGVIGGGGEQADQAPLAGHPAVGVVGLHDHAVHRPDAVDQRRAVGLDDQDVLRPAREAGHRLAAAQPRLEQPHVIAAQDAQRGARDQLVAQAAGLRRIVDIAVAAMAEEGEMVGFQPAQEIVVLGQVGRTAGRQVGDGVEAGAPHRPPVLDRQPHLGQHAGERGGELVEHMADRPGGRSRYASSIRAAPARRPRPRCPKGRRRGRAAPLSRDGPADGRRSRGD